jgi:hypothetical protein
LNEEEKEIKSINILNENNEIKSYNTTEVNYYVDEGGNIWTAVTIGGVADVIILYAILQGSHRTCRPYTQKKIIRISFYD